ncbi:secreted protein [Rhodopirellula sp. SWK7]|nr:secreted protein [Rhodopirellula sp. SWK7]
MSLRRVNRKRSRLLTARRLICLIRAVLTIAVAGDHVNVMHRGSTSWMTMAARDLLRAACE